MSNKKKIFLMSSLVLLLAVTAVFNFVFANASTTAAADGGVTTANYFTTYRSERTATRNEEIVQLDSVIALYEEGDERYDSFFCDSGRNATGFSGFDRGKCATC
jgi:hypothetical protein